MSPDKFLLKIIEGELKKVVALDDPRITHHALRIAFYSAMHDAALDDPMEDAEDQTSMLEYFTSKITEHVETYQKLVNDAM